MLNHGMFTSKTDMYETPKHIFDKLDKEFHFTLDVCAVKENAKCKKFYSPSNDGLKQDWSKDICFMNPPYGKDISKWIKKANKESINTTVVGLLPARTDTKWFHDYIYGVAEIRFIKGRLKFGDSKNSAPFPSMIVVWR